ncbi:MULTISPECIES: hypothetical protein [Cyanophyceae]|uniref:hypothetical protein n=1 Tax=Cyanophyceae TaxID=3028117 RepID=UPI001686218F|nr:MULTISPECIES: hypothetical protein [Cyanophyceae]MBD1916228.1 hypothetical protein [Phormidium sp. FACHB-77]MBD2031503.1 hypothetical protein [Phormidium sp. FACHB-322]MBD2052870.1 hypothetical protein [Leptolyngbya sp. FACHB-60]
MLNKKTSFLLSIALTALSLPLLLVQLSKAQQPAIGTVQGLNMGDRACYVEVVNNQGEQFTEFADFDICEQNLVGKRVQFTYELDNIQAVSCQGNPECPDTERVMLITQAQVISEPNPAPRPALSRVQDLPDGTYRYWNGTPSSSVISDAALLANGGVTFTFSKRGSAITGVFGYVDGEAICIQGQVSGNTVSGFAVQNLQGAKVLSTGETFQSFGPSGYLQVRRGRQASSSVVRYGSALLNLNNLNRINAGSRVPPRGC